jgi:hypothetical protein
MRVAASTLSARDRAFVHVIESVGLDEITAIQVYVRFMSVLERPIQAEIRWGVETLAEAVGIDPSRLSGAWHRARRHP